MLILFIIGILHFLNLCLAADKARQEFQDAERTVRDIKKKLEELNDALNLDVGDDERFAPLLGQCFEYSDREYTYSLCPFNRVSFYCYD